MSTSIHRPRSEPSPIPSASPSSYGTRHSTIGAKTFLFDWPELANADRNRNANANSKKSTDWSTIPSRLHQLVQHFLQHPHLALTESRSITMYPSRSRRTNKYKYNYKFNNDNNDDDDDEIADAMEARRIALTAAMVESCPTHVWNCFEALFAHIIRVHIKLYAAKHKLDNDVSMETDDDDDDDEEEDEDDDEDSLTLPFNEDELYQDLHILQWLNPHNPSKTDILTRSLNQALHDTVNDYVSKKITGIYDQPNLYEQLLLWKSNVLTPLLQRITHTSTSASISDNGDGDGDGDGDGNDDPYEALLHQTISECYCTIRSSEIFDMIADYPDSLPSINDLNQALIQSQKMVGNGMVSSLQQAFAKRLLHPGAQTGQILQVYMNTIKVLRVMDPSDCLLDAVANGRPGVRAYLRQRSDTVRCIITSLTDEEAESDLYEELQRHGHDAVPLEFMQAQYDSEDDDEPPGKDWMPAPSLYYQRIAGGAGSSAGDDGSGIGSGKAAGGAAGGSKNADLLAMLVRIYGSNDLFVDEYRIMLADKLLANRSSKSAADGSGTDREVHNLELLKLRFGENSMRQCEIMIKDMDDSKRIAANIHSTLEAKYQKKEEEEKEEKTHNDPASNMSNDGKKSTSAAAAASVVDAAIISHIFWPPLQKEELKNHPRIQAHLDEYSMEYAKYKNPRRLVWFPQLGEVELELEVMEHDGEIATKEFTCSPLHATLISHFDDSGSDSDKDGCWTARELANETGVAEDVIRKKMGYWVNNNVVKIVRGAGAGSDMTYELASYHDEANSNDDDFYDNDDDGIIVSLSGQEEEEWEAYESYVVGMLSNLGQLPLDRIHNMLKVVVTGSEHKYNKTPQQLSIFLGRLCKDERLECGADGMYKLVKK